MMTWNNIFNQKIAMGSTRSLKTGVTLVPFSLVLPYESRDEILVRGIDL
jgi:hypothetical protein